MCCTSTSTVKESVPKYIEEGGKRAISRAEGIAPRTPYDAPRVAPFSADTSTGFNALRDYFGSTPSTVGASTGMITEAGAAGPQSISTERVVDEGGRLGSIASYMNPHLSSVLDTALRSVGDASAAERKRIGSSAMGARAFGDARHGILESQLGERTARAMGDVAGQISSDAFSQAMGLRSADLARMFGVDSSNAQFAEQALGRKLQSGIALPQAEGAAQSNFLERLASLFGAGAAQESKAQTLLDIPFLESESMRNDEYERLAALVSALSGVPFTRTQSSTQPDNGLFGLLGAAVGNESLMAKI